MKDLEEFTNEDAESVFNIWEKKLEIEQQIKRIKFGEDVKIRKRGTNSVFDGLLSGNFKVLLRLTSIVIMLLKKYLT